MKSDLKRLLKYALFPLVCVVYILAMVALFISLLLYCAGFKHFSEYPTMPFFVVIDWWEGLAGDTL